MSRILIVDDEAPIRQLLTLMCHREGHDVDAVEDGLKAAYLLQREAYDLLITDMTMTPLSGADLVQMARLMSPQTKVIAMSGWSVGEVQAQTGSVGVDRYITKPFNYERFTEVLNEVSAVN